MADEVVDPGLSRRAWLARAGGWVAAAALPGGLSGCGGGGGGGRGSAPRADPPTSALVLGAGAAGLACAQALRQAGLEVRVLEATARRFGRVRTARLSGALPYELGASTVHGPTSSAYDLAVRHGAAFATDALRDRVLTGGFQPTTEFLAGEPDFAAAFAFAGAAGAYAGPSRSVEDRVLDAGLAARTHRWLDAALGAAWGTTNDALDAADLAAELSRATAGPDRRRLRDRSLSELLEAEFGDVLDAIQYSTPIRLVDTTGPRPVAYTAAFTPYEADVVVVAVPLPVLARGDLAFTPTLPAEKAAALAAIGMPPAVSVVLRFAPRLQASDLGTLYGTPGVPAYVAAGFGRGGANDVLAATAYGDEARALAATGDPVGAVLDALGRVFGAGDVAAAFVEGEAVDWTEERWVGGGRSSPTTGSAAARAALAAPVGRRLYFAGEATDVGGHPGTLHGAIDSGRRAAAEVLAADLFP